MKLFVQLHSRAAAAESHDQARRQPLTFKMVRDDHRLGPLHLLSPAIPANRRHSFPAGDITKGIVPILFMVLRLLTNIRQSISPACNRRLQTKG